MRVGYQISVNIGAHRANLAENRPPWPVFVLIEVLKGDREGRRRDVHEVKFIGPTRTEYGWGPERAHARGRRFGAGIWIFSEGPVEYRDETGWHVAP
jgi:hypothetical protein